jgi:Tol biopolymer transport system component
MLEEWKDIAGYEGKYQVSDHGRVRSLARFISCPVHPMKKYYREEIVMRPQGHYNGYKVIYFGSTIKRTKKKMFIHRLVAKAFIENPESKPFVNHKDCDKANNHISNLEWMTEGENTRYHYASIKRVNSDF